MDEDLSYVLYALHKTMPKWHFLNSPFTLISWRRKSSWLRAQYAGCRMPIADSNPNPPVPPFSTSALWIGL